MCPEITSFLAAVVSAPPAVAASRVFRSSVFIMNFALNCNIFVSIEFVNVLTCNFLDLHLCEPSFGEVFCPIFRGLTWFLG